MSLPPTAVTFKRAGSAPRLGSTVELTMSVDVRVSQPLVVSMGELSPALICLVAAAPPSKPEAVERACPEVLRVGEQSLPFTSCSTGESGPHISPGQQ